MKLNGRVELKDGSVELKKEREEQDGGFILTHGTETESQKLRGRLHVNHKRKV